MARKGLKKFEQEVKKEVMEEFGLIDIFIV